MYTFTNTLMGSFHVSYILTELQRADSWLCGRNALQRLWKCCATHSGCICGKSLWQELTQPSICENLLVMWTSVLLWIFMSSLISLSVFLQFNQILALKNIQSVYRVNVLWLCYKNLMYMCIKFTYFHFSSSRWYATLNSLVFYHYKPVGLKLK